LKVTELFFSVPLVYEEPSRGNIRLFARAVEPLTTSSTSASALESQTEAPTKRPWLVYLPGGPGFGAHQPQEYPFTDLILSKGYQVRAGEHARFRTCRYTFNSLSQGKTLASCLNVVKRGYISIPNILLRCSISITAGWASPHQ
jgi:hypothetical protein